MNKIILLLTVLGFAAPVHADQTLNAIRSDEEGAFAIPASKNGMGADVFAKWSLAQGAALEFTTSASNIADGGILLDALCVTSTEAVVGQYTAAVDSDEAASVILGDTAFAQPVRVQAKILAANSTDTGKASCEHFPVPIPLRHGLSLINSHSNIRAFAIYRRIRFQR